MGERLRSWLMAKATKAATATPAQTRAEARPPWRPSTSATSSSPSPLVINAAPSRSRRLPGITAFSGKHHRAAMAMLTPTAASSQYGARHRSAKSSTPVSSGPSAMPSPMLAPHQLAETDRAPASLVTAATSPRPVAIRPAAPTPSTSRPMTNCVAVAAVAHTMEPAAKTHAPSSKTRRRPDWSASAPAVSRLTARPVLIELRIHIVAPGVAASAAVTVAAFGDRAARWPRRRPRGRGRARAGRR